MVASSLVKSSAKSSASKLAIDLRHLQTFLAVAEAKSFSKAAEQLGISQPPLSRQIQRLEAKLNVKLFDRSRAQIQLTAAGAVFAKSAKRIITQVEQGIRDAQQVSQGLMGEVIVGIDGGIIECDRILQFINKYQARFPNLRIVIKELDAEAQAKALQAHEISLGFVESCMVEPLKASVELSAHVVTRDTLSVVLPDFHPLAIAPNLSFTDIAEEAVIMNKRWQQYLSNIAQKQQASFAPNIVQSVSTPRLILSFVASDKGITILPSSTEQQIPHQNLIYKPLQLDRKIDILSAIWRQDETNPTLTAFTKTLMRDSL